MTKSLKTELQKNFGKDKICFTINHWKSYRKGFVGFTAHWYTNELKRHNACIAVYRVIGHCTYDVLAQLNESIIMEFKLTNKVTHCITDSGSNFVKAFAEFSCPAQAHNDCASSADNEDAYAVPITDNLDLQLAEKDYALPPYFKCAVHKLSLVATKDSGLALDDIYTVQKTFPFTAWQT